MSDLIQRIRPVAALVAVLTMAVVIVPSTAAGAKKGATTTTTTIPIGTLLAHTPGATDSAVTQATMAGTICNSRYIKKVKSEVPTSTSAKVFAENKISKGMRSHYAIDHLVPTDLGGTNAITNLWPIPLHGPASPERKAVVDAAVHKSLCGGFVSLATAQGLFNASWPDVNTNLVSPSPTVTQQWFWSETGGTSLMRFVETVSNPGLEPISGVKVSWNALNSSNALVGSYSDTLPTINAMSSWIYIGGAGSANLTGPPASATVTTPEKGSYVKQAATPFGTDSVQLSVSPYGIYTGATDYSVTGDITIGANQIPSTSLDVAIVLTNAAGQVVGGDFDQPDNLPAVLTSGLRIAIQDDVPATSMPTTATIYAAPTS